MFTWSTSTSCMQCLYIMNMWLHSHPRVQLATVRKTDHRGLQDWMQRHPRSRCRRWNVDDINNTMLKKYIGLCINMGFVRKKNIKDYWAQTYPSQYVPFFASVRPFSMFSRLLHVSETNAPIQGQPGCDPWNKVRPVLDAQKAKFNVHGNQLAY